MSAARTKSKKSKKRTHRYTSNVFSMFNQAQIQEFKEAFNMIDQNRDGFIDKDDLIEMLTSLGKNPEDQLLDNMINEAPGAINFTMFLTLFGEKLNGTDPEDVIKNAFGCFDIKTLGVLPQDQLREIMTTMGDRWTDEMVDELFYGAPIKDGLFDYIEFTRMLKHGARDKDDEPMDSQPPQTPTTPKSSAPKFGFQTQVTTGSKGQPVPPKSPAAAPTTQPATQKAQPFWKKPKAKSPPPKPKSPPPKTKAPVPKQKSPPPKQKSPPPKPKSPPPKPKSPIAQSKTSPALTKSGPPGSKSDTSAPKPEPPSPVKPPTPAGQGGKPDLPSGGKPQMPTLKTTLKVQPFQQLQAKLQPPPLKPVLKPTPKNPPK